MQQITKLSLALAIIIMVASCGESKKEGNALINDKRTELEKLKSEKEKLDQKILKQQEELSKIDTSSANPAKIKLVALSPIVRENFEHYIELQGRIDAENISFVTPRSMGGQIKAIYVRQGQQVKKGQLLMKLDDAIQRQQVVATRQQSEGVRTQLNLARSLYERQKNLWDKGIGTEVQLITAKTNVTSLENQLAQIGESVKLSQEQLNTSNVYADVSGVADVVTVRVGEQFPGAGQIKIVNTSSLKVVSSIPENYLSSVNQSTPVVVQLPDLNKSFNTNVSFIGASIDLNNRGFVVEARLPSDASLKPNQLALMKIRDYASNNTIAIPLNTLQ
ncbi:MAG: efflux RND transporter periplasmic adaptor subunit, partial [Pedobacter sp.]